jgi:hypothetical protein
VQQKQHPPRSLVPPAHLRNSPRLARWHHPGV